MKKWAKTVGLLSILVFVLCAVAEGAEKPGPVTIDLKIGSGHPASMTYTQATVEFFEPEIAKRVAAKTNYRIKWIEAYGGTVAKLAEALGATQVGLLDVCVGAFGFEPAKLFLMNMSYYIPFSSQDPLVVAKAGRQSMLEYKDVYEKLWKKYNAKFLALAPTGTYELITRFPVNKTSDLKGHKIAAAGPNLTLLKGTGATPVQSNLNEAYTAMQTGVYDGWIIWPDASYRFKLHEVGKYFTYAGFGAVNGGGIWINLDTWNKLAKEVQDIFVEVGKEYEIKCSDMTKKFDTDAVEKMKKAGAIVTTLSDAEKAKWAAIIPNIAQEKAEEAEKLGYPGKKMWAAYIKSQEDKGHKWPRKWEIK